jgi:3'-phosphoadenosine 5'-phosphosulfate sulfotransferase (PAPS reductase)/FAD synthetase
MAKSLNQSSISLFNLPRTEENFDNIQTKFREFYKQIPNEFMDKLIFSLNCVNDLFVNNTISLNDKIFFAFNGGKDCLAAYILVKYYFYCKSLNLDNSLKESYKQFAQNHDSFLLKNENIYFIYFAHDKNFKEEEIYVQEFAKKENIQIYYIYSDYVGGLNFLIKYYSMKLVIMGTRKDDLKFPLNNESLIHPSTCPYPEFLRFYPVFNWNFEDIWRLIISSNFDYLELYNQGYSSIGKKNNTEINQNLKCGEKKILPAWCLEDFISERNFRDS